MQQAAIPSSPAEGLYIRRPSGLAGTASLLDAVSYEAADSARIEACLAWGVLSCHFRAPPVFSNNVRRAIIVGACAFWALSGSWLDYGYSGRAFRRREGVNIDLASQGLAPDR